MPVLLELVDGTDQHVRDLKRICLDTHYYETYNRDNVKLVDVRRDPIVKITPEGIRTGSADNEFDAIVFATGYDAVTGAVLNIDIHTRDGARLSDKWTAGPRTYLGLM